ncbi:hypothetical protein B5E41_29140 [Rhizobium esperanzae]|uniref:Uncharacterized protein n=1 Tax=Rhizobium esperanzae TaxID=1967781 RepID=A0A246DL89_9HYPH|nr:hypothetical protein [Rhizobium esperanzae]OWO89994.1 hypothetical protein B5E41_29140 [Rhizobium esperanzae]
MTGRKVGRPKKVVPEGSTKVTMQLSFETKALMESEMELRGIEYPAVYFRMLIEASSTLLPLVQDRDSELAEMREMHRETKAMLRVMQRTQADLMRALEIEPAAEPSTDFVDEITMDGDFAEELEVKEFVRPSWTGTAR